jgi:hypothetical protein
MKFATDLSKGILGNPDDPSLWEEIISYIPDSVLLKPNVRILNVACGHGTEAVILAKRMLALGIPKEQVQESIWLIDKYKVFTNHAKLAYGFKNVVTEDFLDWNPNMKFDAVLGNPPYLKGLWVDFLNKAISFSSQHVIMISPDGTNNFSTRSDRLVETLKDNGVQSKLDCTNSFPNVNSGKIVAYNLNINKEHNPQALIDNSVEGIIVNKITQSEAPRLEAMLSGKRSKEHSGSTRHQQPTPGTIKTLESVTKTGPVYAWVNTNNTTVISAKDYWLVNRYFGKDKDATVVETNGKIGISHNILAINRIPGWTVDDFKKVYLSNVYRFTLEVLRKGGFDTSPRHLAQLPILKKSGKSLYKHFSLTQDEIEYIENAVK